MNNQEIAKKVIDALGGRENVNSVAHCATRLRVMVKDEGKINKEVIENLEKVQGAFFNSGQYQIIFGTGTVNKMYDEVVALGLPTSSKDDMKQKLLNKGTGSNVLSVLSVTFSFQSSSYRSDRSLHGCAWSLNCSWNDTSS